MLFPNPNPNPIPRPKTLKYLYPNPNPNPNISWVQTTLPQAKPLALTASALQGVPAGAFRVERAHRDMLLPGAEWAVPRLEARDGDVPAPPPQVGRQPLCAQLARRLARLPQLRRLSGQEPFAPHTQMVTPTPFLFVFFAIDYVLLIVILILILIMGIFSIIK